MPERTRVLVPIGEPIGGQMSAVGIRQFEIGRVLAHHCDVTFASTAATNDEEHGIPVVRCRSRTEFRRLLHAHDVLYTLGLNADRFVDVVKSGIRVVLDIYTPLAYEMLEAYPEAPTNLLGRMHRRIVRWTNAQILHADFIVCTNEKQRDLWLGVMNAIGRLTAEDTRRNPDCRALIDVASFGIPDKPPARNGHPLRDRLTGIGPQDFVLLWSSKILAWQDPVTLLEAMRILLDEDPGIRLVFLGIGPVTAAGSRDWFDPTSLRTRDAVAVAANLGLTDKNVFFVTDRIPYRDVGSYYLDADAAVSTYPNTLETRFCLGSRIFDYVWAGLPMVISGCDLQRDFVEGQRLGFVVPPSDAQGLADAIRRLKDLVTRGESVFDFTTAQRRLTWSQAARSIINYCTSVTPNLGRPQRRVWVARLQHVEFLARSLEIRARVRLSGARHG